jgi:hypothetical protein
MPKGKIAHRCEHDLEIRDCPPCSLARRQAYYKAYCDKRGGIEAVNADRAKKDLERRRDPVFADKERARGREYWQLLRIEVMGAYGGQVCACCGETEPLFLEIDHINNDGATHRRSLGYDGNGKGANGQTLQWLKRNGYPAGFQILCANCNKGKARNGGTCPHKTKACKHHSE